MKSLKVIRLFYYLYTVYTFCVILVSDYDIATALLGLAAIWLLYFVLHMGITLGAKKAEYDEEENPKCWFPFSNPFELKPIFRILLIISVWMFACLAVRYYTGRGVVDIVLSMGSTSAYEEYQEHFRKSYLTGLTLGKIPFALMLIYNAIILTVSYMGAMTKEGKLTLFDYFYLLMISLGYYLFGFGRGTNFEMFCIFIVAVYCLLSKGNSNKNILKDKRFWIVFGCGAVMVLIFNAIVSARGGFVATDICNEIHFNTSSWLVQTFPAIAKLGVSVFSYLGYGIFLIGTLIKGYVLKSPLNFVSILIPEGSELISGSTLSQISKQLVELGYRWIPDYVLFTNSYGLLLTLVMVFGVGYFYTSTVEKKMPKSLAALSGLFIYIEMLSMPIGNYIGNSTPMFMCFVYIVGYMYKYLIFDSDKGLIQWIKRKRT